VSFLVAVGRKNPISRAAPSALKAAPEPAGV
jgi:hypothetical protein